MSGGPTAHVLHETAVALPSAANALLLPTPKQKYTIFQVMQPLLVNYSGWNVLQNCLHLLCR